VTVIALVEDNLTQIEKICRCYGVARLDLFGSAAGEAFDPEGSDLDFVVSFEPRDPSRLFQRYFGLEEDLEALFELKVDLVMEGAVGKNRRFAKSVQESRIPLYGS
jgi:predicted nucleotidyltransferase